MSNVETVFNVQYPDTHISLSSTLTYAYEIINWEKYVISNFNIVVGIYSRILYLRPSHSTNATIK